MVLRLVILISFLSLLSSIYAQNCNATSLCPSTAPCCSEYGYCGTGTYCLQGCEPLFSHKASSCKPDPICQSTTTNFNDLSRVNMNATTYNGNVTAYDWVVTTGQLIPDEGGDGVKLILNQTNSGTKISSTRYVHYGTIDFVMEASKWAGVVTAAITMSDVKDEIDWEFPGTNTTSAQTNYWFLGIANYSATQGMSVVVDSDTSSNFHTYTLDWQEDYLNWVVDGTVMRTVLKSDTLVDGVFKYPSTPSLIQISIWPAGIPTSAQGTIDWSGGLIDWTDPDYVSQGYFWNTIQSVSITCANGTAGEEEGVTGWVYDGNVTGGVPNVLSTNESVMLGGAGRNVPDGVSGLGGIAGFAGVVILGFMGCISVI